MPTVLIGSEPIRHQIGPFRALLEGAGFSVLDPDTDAKLTSADLLRWLPASDAIIAGGETISAEAISASPRLRVIARTGVGYDAVDVSAASARGIAVTITPGANHEAVAEQVFALLLALVKDVVPHDRAIRTGNWIRSPLPRPLRGRTLGLVGLGRIGRAVASRAAAFGMRIVAAELIEDAEFDRLHAITRVGLDELFARSDFVSLHLPLVESTRGLINRASMARMKPGAVLINTSRGGLIVEDDLVEVLRSGHLAGAGLDVFDQEPPPVDHPLRSLPNVVASPHMAGIDTQSMSDMAEMAARCIVDLFEGRWPSECVVNPLVGPAWGH
ncbi:phosphoglycerate dehydrogenase [Tundrisphaera lichenicola]|uniref:phosphoglycerate dehydrogenase n=1 Tax=Tundrisphaera lichenicola TaxID=2029860 RepID=UPI003EBC955B